MPKLAKVRGRAIPGPRLTAWGALAILVHLGLPLLAVLGAGAYGMAMASTYNSRPLAAEVMVHGDVFAVTRPRRTIEAMIADERMPAWLA